MTVVDSELTVLHELDPVWDADKKRVLGSAPEGVFDLGYAEGAPLSGEWWVVCTASGNVVGFGWLDATLTGDAEVQVAVLASARGQGVGSLLLHHLEEQAATRGLTQVCNRFPSGHPDPEALHDWLEVRGYRIPAGDSMVRKRVGGAAPPPAWLRRGTRRRP